MSFGPSVRNGVGLGLGSVPSLQNAPPYASLNLRFNESTTLDPRITFSRASTGTYVDSAGVLQTAAIDAPRFDYDPSTLAPLGLLLEESRTNSLRNNTMQGAVAGTPGTLPTNWLSSVAGLNSQVVEIGTQNGVNYIDIRLSGTTTGANAIIYFDSLTQVVAAVGQSWASSFWFGIVGGSNSNITLINNSMTERTAAGGFLATGSGTDLKLTGSNLIRTEFVRTLNSASTARLSSQLVFTFAIGVAIDITIRIGMPQLERGVGASSVIPTTTTALTRAVDTAAMTGTNFSDWFNPVEGTFVTQYDVTNIATGLFPVIIAASDNTVANRIQVSYNQTSRRAVITTGGSNIFDASLGTGIARAVDKTGLAYKTSNFGACVNGGAVSTGVTGVVPVVDRLILGNYLPAGSLMVGHICSIAYYPRRVSNGELQGLTA